MLQRPAHGPPEKHLGFLLLHLPLLKNRICAYHLGVREPSLSFIFFNLFKHIYLRKLYAILRIQQEAKWTTPSQQSRVPNPPRFFPPNSKSAGRVRTCDKGSPSLRASHASTPNPWPSVSSPEEQVRQASSSFFQTLNPLFMCLLTLPSTPRQMMSIC